MRKLLLAVVSGLVLAGGLTGCNLSGTAARATGTSSHTVQTMDNFGEII